MPDGGLSLSSLLRKPSAWAPIVLSVLAMGLIVAFVATIGIHAPPAADEGAPARLFQLWMLVEAAAVAYFAIRWVPAAPRAALATMALQLVLAAIPVVTITLLES